MSSATALLVDAETSIKAGDWDQALEQLENLKKEQPSQPEVYEKLAHVLAVRGKFQSVITTYLELIRLLLEADNLPRANDMVDRVLELRPDSGEARERRIEIENKRGNTARAVYLSRELARLCIDQGDGERSIRLLQDALKHEPGNLDIALELAEMFVSHGHIQDGANQYRKVANSFQEAGNIAKAAEAYRRMKVVQSDDPEVLLTLGRLYTELGKLDEAEQEFRSVLRHDLDHEQALLQLGLVCQLKGRFRSGILAFNKVLQNNPNLVAAKRKLGELHHSQGMMTEAVDFFLQAAQGHLEADEKDDAIECFQIVLSVDENNAPAQQGLTNLGAPVQPKVFEAPQPPTPVEDEPPAPEPPPPPPVPFEAKAAAAPVSVPAPEPVGGSTGFATEKTERLSPMNFDAPAASEPEPPKAEPTAPKRSPGGMGIGGGSSLVGGKRLGLGQRQGLTMPGGDKPMLGGEKPVLQRGGGATRHGLGQRTLGGMSPGGADKPILPGPGERRPVLPNRQEPSAPPPGPSSHGRDQSNRGSFTDTAPIEDFDEDMAREVFADPPPSAEPVSTAADEDEFSLPDASFFDDAPGTSGSTIAVSGALFDDEPPAAAAPLQIGDFSFDSDEDSSPATTSLRPDYAQDTSGFGGNEELGDDLFDFDASPDSPQPSLTPTLGGGGGLFEDRGEDLFGDSPGDIFGETPGADLFGDSPAAAVASPPAGEDLFNDVAAGQDQGLFEGDNDPFNLFDDAGADSEPTTLGGASPGGFTFDDEGPGQVENEAPLGSIFDDLEPESKSIPLSLGEDDLFQNGGDDLFNEASAPAVSLAPTISKEPDDGLFGQDSQSNDLFNDDLFGGQDDGDLNPGFSNPNATAAPGLAESSQDAGGMDLFSSPDEDADGLSPLDEPLDGAGDGFSSLFGEEPVSAGLFEDNPQNGMFDGEDLFNADSEGSSAGLFEAAPPAEAVADDATFQGAGGLFEDAFPQPETADRSDSAGLFDGLDGGSDTLFDGFGESDPIASGPDDGLFGGSETNELFSLETAQEHPAPGMETLAAPEQPTGSSDGLFSDDLFGGDPEPISLPMPGLDDELSAGEDQDLFGGFPQPDAVDDLRLPLAGEEDPNLFEDDGSAFDIPLTTEAAAPQAEPAAEEFSFAEPSPIDIPQPVEPTEAARGGLFESEDAGLFGFSELEEAPPLELDLPMPDDPPMFSDSPVQETAPTPQDQESASLFEGDVFDDGGVFDTALDFDIPAPSAEPVAAAPSVEPTAIPEPEPEVEAPDPEFMAMLELTMPKAEEESVAIPEPEPVVEPALPLPQAEDEVLDIPDFAPVSSAVEEELFDTTLNLVPSAEEPAPVFEEPVAAEPDPADLLSAEEKAEIAQTMQADSLEATLTNADAASKIAAYRKALEENPDNLVLRGRLADIHLKFGLLEDAVVQYRQVMRRSPDSISLLHRVIQAEFWNENYVEAGDSLLALAKLHLKRGEMHEALDTLQSVLSLDPLHFEARKELVSVFTALDESKLAAHHLRQLAETALTKGEVEGAIQAFQQLLEISADPTFEERLAQIYESQGDVAKALSSFQSLVGRYRAEDRWEEAARVTERIVELDPNQLQDREALIELYQRLGQEQQAVEQQFQLARRYQERGDIERATRLYEDVLKVQTDNHEARRNLVDAYLDAGRVSTALEQAEALTEHYLDTKDHNTAIDLYSRLVDADPENVDLQERLVKFYGLAGDPENAKSRWIHISHLHERNARYERAAEAVQKALELDETQLDLLHRLALLYAEKLNDNQSALNQLRKLFQLAPDRTDAVKMYIDLLLKEEQVAEAGKALQRLEQTGGDGVEIKANVIALLKASVESNPGDLKARFNYGELCYHLGDLDHAIEQFQQTRRHPDFELISYNMLGLCFASKRGYMMLDLAIKQFQKGLESKGRSEQDYLEIRYNLAMVQYQNGRAKEALAELKECYNVDIAYRDVRSWIQKIEGELASGA